MGLAFLSQEWLDRQRELDQERPAVSGASARIEHVVTVGRKEQVAYVTTVVDGRITASEAGGAAEDVDATLLISHADAVAVLRGELEPDVAFMRGEMKLRGDMRAFLAVLPTMVGPEARAVRAALLAETDLG